MAVDGALRRFDEPPGPRRGRVDWARVVAEAEAYPNEWVESPVSVNPSVASQMRHGRYRSVDPAKFEIITAMDPDNRTKSFVYLRVRRG